MQLQRNIELGCGLISIGRQWGYKQSSVPSESEARRFLEYAYTAGIRYFDTAPAYGLSEQRLGTFLHSLNAKQRQEITVATKFGEHWEQASESTRVDHSAEALKISLDNSLKLLGEINVLQLHKTNSDVLRSDSLQAAWEYARTLGISRFGASVSDYTGPQ